MRFPAECYQIHQTLRQTTPYLNEAQSIGLARRTVGTITAQSGRRSAVAAALSFMGGVAAVRAGAEKSRPARAWAMRGGRRLDGRGRGEVPHAEPFREGGERREEVGGERAGGRSRRGSAGRLTAGAPTAIRAIATAAAVRASFPMRISRVSGVICLVSFGRERPPAFVYLNTIYHL